MRYLISCFLLTVSSIAMFPQNIAILDSSIIQRYDYTDTIVQDLGDGYSELIIYFMKVGDSSMIDLGKMSYFNKSNFLLFGLYPNQSDYAFYFNNNETTFYNFNTSTESMQVVHYHDNGRIWSMGTTINKKQEGFVSFYNKKGKITKLEFCINDKIMFRIDKFKKINNAMMEELINVLFQKKI